MGKKKQAGATRALQALDRAGVVYQLIEYEHSERMENGYALDTSQVLGIDPRLIFKTLIAKVDSSAVVAVVPASGRLNLKSLAKAAGGKSAAMMEPAQAEKLTGYVTGGISPLGQMRQLPTYIDSSAKQLEKMIVSAGKRTLSASLRPADLASLTGAIFVPIAAD
ncbi:Cys-tRNA(Pro) deacylase [Trueperella pecoris]|uniref:Cys-tRNA(Pro) deacylase n=1 Tax=Trueperella pecoris TaxID=2733571 RepID=UPI00186B5C86|nr:Cys-tRNA(Pro) deacylase [Trueperella pecoris]QOQ38727.1 Cys-tRNA(Pro) deacylase [Trueperella pecoris]QTG74704.1 Cys-tRNA(Pro) deacylase [Trueperella pecoris]